MVSNQISMNPFSIARVLGAVAFLLVLASLIGQLMTYVSGQADVNGLAWFFYVDGEYNIPSSFSALLLLFAALLLAVITLLEREQSNSMVLHWMVLSLGFFYMATDEVLSFHEKAIMPVRKLLGNAHYGVFYYAWVIPGIVVVFILGLFFLRFLSRLPVRTRFAFLTAGILYVGGAIGVELIGGRFDELHGKLNLTYSMIVTAEESLEMAGVIIFIWALLRYIADNYKEVRFRFVVMHKEVPVNNPK